MTKQVQQFQGQFLDPGFLWKDRNDVYHEPKQMATRHLFYTLCMIWNHSVPYSMRTHDFIAYDFGGFYTVNYMAKAVINLYEELKTRQDMTEDWKSKLNHIKDCIRRLNHERISS